MTSQRRILAAGLLFLFVALLIPSVSWADRPTQASVNNFHPATDETRYMTIYGSQTFQPGRFKLGLYGNYANRPLIINLGAGSTRRAEIVNRLVMADVLFAVGFTDWFQAGVDLPVVGWENYFDPNVASPTGENFFARPGDARLDLKFRFLDIDRWGVGLALVPFVTFPSGFGQSANGEELLIGNNSWTGGGILVFDFDIAKVVQFSLNAGFMTRDDITVRNVRQNDMALYGAGLSFKLAKWLELSGEGWGTTVVNDFLDLNNMRELPLEVGGSLRFLPGESWRITFGGTAGMTIGYGTPDYRGIFGLEYVSPKSITLPPPPPPPPEEVFARLEEKRIVITRKIHFEFDKANIRPVSYPILDAVVQILVQNPQVRKIQIEGHTDWIGSNKYNQKLSQRRSDAVRDYLIAKGVEGDRLVARGFGEEVPLDTNKTAIGRARNRRVEFNILEKD